MQSENFQCTFTFGLYHHFSCIPFRIQKQKDALDKWLEKSKCEYILALKGLDWKIEFTPIEHVLQLNFTLKIVHFRFSFKQMAADFFHTIFFCMLQINSKFFFFISELDSVHCFLCQHRQLFHFVNKKLIIFHFEQLSPRPNVDTPKTGPKTLVDGDAQAKLHDFSTFS